MRRMLIITLILPTLLLAQRSPARVAAAGPTYTITDLGATFQASGVNDSGEVAGSMACFAVGGRRVVPRREAAIWTSSGGSQCLGLFGPADFSTAMGINNTGVVTGYQHVPGSPQPEEAILWTGTGGLQDPGTPDANPGDATRAYAVNDSDQMAATEVLAPEYYPYLVSTTPSGVALLPQWHALLPLCCTVPQVFNLAFGINNSGWIVGTGVSPQGTADSFLLTPPTVTAGPTGVSVASSLNPSVYGQSITLTATGTPDSIVTFSDGGTPLGTAPLDASGTASVSTSALSAGDHTITVAYSGERAGPRRGRRCGLVRLRHLVSQLPPSCYTDAIKGGCP